MKLDKKGIFASQNQNPLKKGYIKDTWAMQKSGDLNPWSRRKWALFKPFYAFWIKNIFFGEAKKLSFTFLRKRVLSKASTTPLFSLNNSHYSLPLISYPLFLLICTYLLVHSLSLTTLYLALSFYWVSFFVKIKNVSQFTETHFSLSFLFLFL